MTASDRPLPVRRKGGSDRPRRSSPSHRTRPAAAPEREPTVTLNDASSPIPRFGWTVIARKEVADHLNSIRFYVLVGILMFAAVVPLYFGAEQVSTVGRAVTGFPALFLQLFLVGPADTAVPAAFGFIAIVGPLMGVAFAFDAINSERSGGTLSRLLSQPIHRDDVVNGKFIGSLAVIMLGLAIVILSISIFGVWRLGILPDPNEVVRIVLWYGVTALYISFWLAIGLLLSVVFRRAATAGLVGFGLWLLVAVFGPLLISFLATVVSPVANATSDDQFLSAQAGQQQIARLSPHTLYTEAAAVLLRPDVASLAAPASFDEWVQSQQQVGGILPVQGSLVLVFPHVVILFGLTLGVFALAYAQFMRQEVRA
jgi:ABC-2 type transport system permease protein